MSAERKLHIIDTADPLICWNGLIARCGYTFHRAEPLWMFRDTSKPSDPWLQALSLLMVCKDCLNNPPISEEDKREYVYGLIEAQVRFLEGQAS